MLGWLCGRDVHLHLGVAGAWLQVLVMIVVVGSGFRLEGSSFQRKGSRC